MKLKNDYRFVGRVKISGEWISAPILLQKNFALCICLPDIYRINRGNEIPELIEGHIEGWEIQINDGVSAASIWRSTFHQVMEKNQFTANEANFISTENRQNLWTEITIFPETCTFIKNSVVNEIPDKWGVTFYPDNINKSLFDLFDRNRNPRKPPDILTSIDSSLYFDNSKQWSLEAIGQRLKLLTSCLSLFVGAPITYQLLVGRYGKEILCFQIKNVSNPNAYICPSHSSGCVGIKEDYLPEFSSNFINNVESIFNRNNEREKILILLSYFNILYAALYDEAKIAFSYQLMESLAKYRDIKFGGSYVNDIAEELSKKVCPTCRNLIKEELKIAGDHFIAYISKALEVIKVGRDFKAQPGTIKKIAEKYRNHVFHGSFFDEMTKIDGIVATLPEGFQDDLPELFQAIVSLIGAHFILEIDFNKMIAIKRKLQ